MPSSTDNPELGIYQLPPYHLLNPQGRSPVVLVCEHASRHIPLELQRLGLDQAAAEEHIAWDIGALALAEELSRRLDAPLLAAGYSRLLIDLNRPLEAPDSIPPHSEVYPVPGNRELSETVRRYRQDCLFHPFHQRLTQLLDERQAAGVPTRVVGVHSFTTADPARWLPGCFIATPAPTPGASSTVCAGTAWKSPATSPMRSTRRKTLPFRCMATHAVWKRCCWRSATMDCARRMRCTPGPSVCIPGSDAMTGTAGRQQRERGPLRVRRR